MMLSHSVFEKKKKKSIAESVDPNLTARLVQSDLGLHCPLKVGESFLVAQVLKPVHLDTFR